jgi:hypothetical protein
MSADVICSIDGCALPVRARGWCRNHWYRWRKHGDPLAGLPVGYGEQLRQLLAAAVVSKDRSTCWLDWPGSHSHGYPCIANTKVAHLVLIADGRAKPAAPANHALHSCDTPECWNPDHLRWGTHRENTADAKARARIARGERSPHAKLTAEQVLEIRSAYAAGSAIADLAREHHVTYAAIQKIVLRETWDHLADEAVA